MIPLRKLTAFGLFVLLPFLGVAQDTLRCTGNLDEEAQKMFHEALNIQNKEKARAIRIMRQVESRYPRSGAVVFHLAELNYQMGMVSLNEINPERIRNNESLRKARKQFERVITLCPSYKDYSAFYYLGMYHYDIRNYQEARKYLGRFIDNSSSSYEALKQAKESLNNVKRYMQLVNNPVDYQPKKLVKVNTEADEYLPVISPDGNYLFFTRFVTNEGKQGQEAREKFMISRFHRNDTGGFFGKPQSMPYPFNQGSNQGGGCVTINNHAFFITMCSRVHTSITSYKNCDIYVSYYHNGKWTDLKNLGAAINSRASWEAQPSISSDGNSLYFASARQDGYGGIDIYRSEKDEDGLWTKAENLGPTINTSGDDKTPFIHPDNKTLYFSSNGHFGLGGFDMFVARRKQDGSWKEPENLGYPLNTENDELAYVISTNGRKMYFASKDLRDNGNWDLFEAVLPEKARPDSVLLVKGYVFDEYGNPVKDASVELQNVTTLKIIEGLVDRETGDYAIATSVDKEDEFVVTARKDGFFFNSRFIKPSKNNIEAAAKMDFVMQQVEVGTRIRLRNIYFDTNSARFDEVSQVTLHSLLRFMQLNPTIHITIHGHTDSIGTDADNLRLSRRRARAVHDFLAKNGIDSTRVSYEGFGERRPIATNATRKGRAKNRRTEFVVTVK